MSIQITHNTDGSITAACGGEELRFFPNTRSAGTSAGANPIVDTWKPPISTGDRHRTFLYVPVGDQTDTFGPGGYGPTIEFGDNQRQFEHDFTQLIRSSRFIDGAAGQPSVRVVADTGMRLDVGKVLSVADSANIQAPISVFLTSKPLHK